MTTHVKTFAWGALAMSAFAGNSILNRYALIDGTAGAWGFTLIRLVSGAIMLALLTRFRVKGGSWAGAGSLLIYAAGFSFAYLAMDAALGALVLFTAVQFTMMGRGITVGEQLTSLQWLGALIAFVAMIWLLWPVNNASHSLAPIWAIASMIAAGVGWGAYSLIGRQETAPLLATTGNFARAALIALCLSIPIFILSPEAAPPRNAVLAAITSGAITSGIGYAIWYAAVPSLSRMQAGIMQLSVPALAALGGIIFLNETMTPRLWVSAVLILIGVAVATLHRQKVNDGTMSE